MSGGETSAAPGAKRRRRAARVWIAGGISAALVATIAVIASGYDAREVPRAEPGVWVARDAGQYARVNTDTGEIDAVKRVENPSGLVQSDDRAAVLTHGNGRAWPVDAAAPEDLGTDDAGTDDAGADADAEADDAPDAGSDAASVSTPAEGGDGAVNLPQGARDVVTAGDFVAVRTEAGQVYAGTLHAEDGADPIGGNGDDLVVDAEQHAADLGSRLAGLTPVDAGSADAVAEPEDAEGEAADGYGAAAVTGEPFSADAVAVSPDGVLVTYAAETGVVSTFTIARNALEDEHELPPAARGIERPQLAVVDGDWVLLDTQNAVVHRARGGETALETTGEPRLQASGSSGGVYVADTAGLIRLGEDGSGERVASADGAPAQPVPVDGSIAAAWLGQQSGALWTGAGDPVSLDYDDSLDDPGELAPVFRVNGARAVLSEMGTGMLWTVPDGTAIPLSQWDISDPPKEDEGIVVVDEVTEQVPPTAQDDDFGVRAGAPAQLPVLLNDFDANQRDVLTIVPESLEASPLPDDFGSVELLPDGQGIAAEIADGASGSASFTYRVTDGGLTSDAATVTLTVADAASNSGPQWCPVMGCQREWGVPAIAPGGTLVAPLLDGWVDPESDVMMLAGVRVVDADAPVTAIVTGDGRLAVRHTDPNAGAAETTLEVAVRDSRGEETARELTLRVQPDAPPVMTAAATSAQVDEPAEIRPLARVMGGSGAFEVTDAAAQGSGSGLSVAHRSDVVEVTASEAGSSLISVTVRDVVTGLETTGTVRVTATTEAPELAFPPMRAFIRPLSDAVVDVLDAVPGSTARTLSVVSADPVDGEVEADVIGHERVRVAGATPDGGAGRVGEVDVTVTDGSEQVSGRLTVFQVSDSDAGGTVAVADTATVRAGSVVDIPVLRNDVSAAGDRLLLDPEVVGSGTEGELAFASGSTLRYLAPDEPGTYRLSYTTSGASQPDATDVGTVLVTVVAEGANRDPAPATLTARVAPDEQTDVAVPVSGVDPDGDRVRLMSVDPGADPRISATVGSDGASISVAASGGAEPGVHELEYAVRDDAGGEGTGRLRVVVSDADGQGRSPVAATDHIRMPPGGDPVTIRPLDNDVDPARGALALTAIEPNVAGGADSAEYRRLAERLDDGELAEGRVAIAPGDDLGTVSYRYTVRSSETSSTATGLIVVHTSERVGTQAPAVSDSVLTVGDRAALEGDGIDVLTGKVRWATGDPDALQLSLWGESADRYDVDGSRISGEYDPEGDQVVFRVTGTDATGADVTTYGLLVVPPLDELRLTLKPGIRPLSVLERQSADMRVETLVEVASSDQIEVRSGALRVGREQASCAAVSGTTVRYTAGAGAPWDDVCVVDVRLDGQERWSSLPVPIAVVPREPVAELQSITRTVAPGASEAIDLADMVVWRGEREGSPAALRFEAGGSGGQFDTRLEGGVLQVAARADATPGRQQAVTVQVTGAGDARGSLTLRVGTTPRDLPRGGTVALQCTVDSDCRTDLVGVAGEHDPFAGKSGGGLELVSVSGGSCAVGTLAQQGDRGVRVAWGDRTTGGTCTAGFTVRDAQNRVGEGTIELDAQGVPDAPASIAQTGYDATSATFTVTLGPRAAHPAVSGVELSGAGSTSCAPRGGSVYQCVASGLRSGEQHRFTARAINDVGRSAASSAVTAWAYEAPRISSVDATAVKNASNADQSRGGVRVSVVGSSDAASFEVRLGGSVLGTISGPRGSETYSGIPVGGQTFTVTPVTRHQVPSIGGSSTGSAAQASVTVIGAPRLSGATLVPDGNTGAVATAQGVGAHAGEALRTTFALGAVDQCGTGNTSGRFSDLTRYQKYRATACVSSEYGFSRATSSEVRVGGRLEAPTVDRGYEIAVAPSSSGGTSATYGLVSAPNVSTESGATLQYRIDGRVNVPFAVSPDRVSDIAVRQCFDTEASCSDWVGVAPHTAPASVEVSTTGTCFTGDNAADLVNISAAARPYATVTAGEPDGDTVLVTITWGGRFGMLESATLTACTE
ncbi:Ig-like domain-containing protein [Leucobacter tardus]|uniref:Fibronectin type-III domain-containing protein n=1 Tax=Leucobacter tardus TaxID=501483 RepID=A0A939TLL8_9MICO|nr:Ig-like domain-containing protein [Leucobacter tardus]MBO2988543.1 hypothetical protein [Leucobacter tardus]